MNLGLLWSSIIVGSLGTIRYIKKDLTYSQPKLSNHKKLILFHLIR
jgi:hypothetical protein